MAYYNSEIIKVVGHDSIEVTKVDHDYYGNPRYVFNFMNISSDYSQACKHINKYGGSKYRGKWYGGGVVISSYSLQNDLKRILDSAKEKGYIS